MCKILATANNYWHNHKMQFLTHTSNTKLICFDMDGTLFNTEPLHVLAFKQSLSYFDLQLSSDLSSEDLIGKSDLDAFCALIKNSPISAKEFIDKKNQFLIIIIEQLTNEQRINLSTKGVREFLQSIKNKNIPCCVVSASEAAVVKLCLLQFQLHQYFDSIISNADIHRSKPCPSPYLYAMRNFSVSTSETIIFEDSPTGIQSALLSGATVWQVTEHLHESKQALDFKNFKGKIANFIGQI